MSRVRQIGLQFPFGGLAKRMAYQSEGPFTTPSCENVYADCAFEERERGGSRPAIRKFFSTQIGSGNQLDLLESVTYHDGSSLSTILVAASNGTLYKESGGDWAAVTSDLSLASGSLLHAIDYLGKLYIADYAAPLASETDGATSFAVLTSSSAGDFAALGVNQYDYAVVITDGGTGATEGTYFIDSVSTTDITLSTDPGDATGISFRVQRCPKVYDPSANTLTVWSPDASKGSVPVGYPLIGNFLDRILLSGSPLDQGEVLACRRGTPGDWLYADTDASSAWAMSTDATSGHLPEHVRQMIPHPDRCVIFGMHTSYAVLRGDPTYGGSAKMLSPDVGGLSGKAWCFDDRAWLWMMTQDGLYVMPQNCGGTPRPVSRELLPQDLLNIPSTSTVSMAWDVRYRAIHLYVTPSTGDGTHYLIDTRQTEGEWRAAFFPQTYQTDHQPTAVHAARNRRSDYSLVLLGGSDGYVRRLKHDVETDDGDNAITSHVEILLARLGGSDYSDGMIREMIMIAAGDSGEIDWKIRTGASAEEAFDETNDAATGVFDRTGRSYIERPWVRGPAAVIRLENGQEQRWAMERLVLIVDRKQRVLL